MGKSDTDSAVSGAVVSQAQVDARFEAAASMALVVDREPPHDTFAFSPYVREPFHRIRMLGELRKPWDTEEYWPVAKGLHPADHAVFVHAQWATLEMLLDLIDDPKNLKQRVRKRNLPADGPATAPRLRVHRI